MYYRLSKKNKKELQTKILKEIYHDYVIGKGLSRCSCGLTGCIVRESCTSENRNFDNYHDVIDLFKVIVKLKKWDSFKLYTQKIWEKEPSTDYILWLFGKPNKFCYLVYNWLINYEKTNI